MDYPVRVPGFEHLDLVLRADLFGPASLRGRESELPSGATPGEYLLTRADGTLQPVRLAPRPLNLDLPRLRIGDDVIDIVRPLTPLQWIWCGLPALFMSSVGVALYEFDIGVTGVGVLVGAFALILSSLAFRSCNSLALGYVASGVVSALAIAIYCFSATSLTGGWSSKPTRKPERPLLPVSWNGAINNAAFAAVFPSPPSESDQITTGGKARPGDFTRGWLKPTERPSRSFHGTSLMASSKQTGSTRFSTAPSGESPWPTSKLTVSRLKAKPRPCL